jgi:hypothetical protein
MTSFYTVTDEDAARFETDGFLLLEDLYSSEEIELLNAIGRADKEKAELVHSAVDTRGGESKLWLTSAIDREDIYNGFCHGRHIVDTMERLLADEVYLYHYKMMEKEPRVGGAWEWHQDYGYWYNNGCLFPHMASCFVAIDPSHRGNGCLQVLRGSHKLGRIEHGRYGSQTGANPERVALARQHLELVYGEMKPGDALFFHANILHSSDQNSSDQPRWGLICCYNARGNPCDDKAGHPSYRPLEKWDDTRLLELGRRQWQELQQA